MKFWTRLFLLIVVDFIIIWLLVGKSNPDPSVTIAILLLVPLAIFINLIIALILYFTKREFALLFVANTIPASIIMYYVFIAGIDRHQNLRYEGWSFKIKDTTYRITHSKLNSSFYISYSTKPGLSVDFFHGKFKDSNNQYLMTTDTTQYIISSNYLYGFRSDSLKLTIVEY